MKTFQEYAVNLSLEFDNIYSQAEEEFKKKKYNIAWELIQSAKPANIEQSSIKAHFIEILKDKQSEFLMDMKKRKI